MAAGSQERSTLLKQVKKIKSENKIQNEMTGNSFII